MTFTMRLLCCAVIVGVTWLLAEPAIHSYKARLRAKAMRRVGR